MNSEVVFLSSSTGGRCAGVVRLVLVVSPVLVGCMSRSMPGFEKDVVVIESNSCQASGVECPRTVDCIEARRCRRCSMKRFSGERTTSGAG